MVQYSSTYSPSSQVEPQILGWLVNEGYIFYTVFHPLGNASQETHSATTYSSVCALSSHSRPHLETPETTQNKNIGRVLVAVVVVWFKFAESVRQQTHYSGVYYINLSTLRRVVGPWKLFPILLLSLSQPHQPPPPPTIDCTYKLWQCCIEETKFMGCSFNSLDLDIWMCNIWYALRLLAKTENVPRRRRKRRHVLIIINRKSFTPPPPLTTKLHNIT